MYRSRWMAAIFPSEKGVAMFTRRSGAKGSAQTQWSARISPRVPRGAVLVVRGQPCAPTEAGTLVCALVERVRLLEGEVAVVLPGLAGAGGRAEGPATVRVAVNAASL